MRGSSIISRHNHQEVPLHLLQVTGHSSSTASRRTIHHQNNAPGRSRAATPPVPLRYSRKRIPGHCFFPTVLLFAVTLRRHWVAARGRRTAAELRSDHELVHTAAGSRELRALRAALSRVVVVDYMLGAEDEGVEMAQ